MLYPQNNQKNLSNSLFQSPTAEYRGTPFWAWNCELNADELVWQIDQMKEMGLGGFHMHCRSGMSTPYLTDEFMGLVRTCVEKARENHMLAWLYDEDRWPSGAAGGLVTKDHAYRARTLLFTVKQQENEVPLAIYAISLDEKKCLNNYRLMKTPQEAAEGEMIRYAYLKIEKDNPWYNNQAYLDTLNPEAVKKFIEVTHERYAQCFQEDFGGVIPAIFTDEPQFSPKRTLTFPESDVDAVIPWTDDLEETYQKTYGESLLEKLPEVFWELPDDVPSPTRYHFHDHLTERFTQAFADQIGAWCEKHNIMLTGHMMEEPTLRSQTRMLGEAMRSYRGFQLPGIDMLCDRREFTTAKQAQSAAHQYGRPGVMSELYGVTNWDYEFRGHKSQGDWQAALGVTVRVPHLAWVSMEGAAKRDYPACINYQSPWYKEYAYVENHFARLNTALTRGIPQVKVGMIHPIESYWLRFGPAAQTDDRRAEMDDRFQKAAEWLLHGLIDFDYICESLLPEQCHDASAPLQVGKMAYDVVIVPGCETIRTTTLERLEKFVECGGKLIFMGNIPPYVDALPSDRALKLAEKSRVIPYTCFDLLESLEELREIDVRTQQGSRAPGLLHQIRKDGDGKWLFLCNGHLPARRDQPDEWEYTLSISGKWIPTVYDTMTGAIKPAAYRYAEEKTVLNLIWHGHDSLLLYLAPTACCTETIDGVVAPGEQVRDLKEVSRFRGMYPITLSEPNVLLLDQAEYSYDNGPWQPKKEILWLEGELRSTQHLSPRHSYLPQPWVVPADDHFDHYLSLRFTIESEIALKNIQLALEKPETTEITWNGEKITAAPEGYFVDKSIKTVPLPDLKIGKNTLVLHLPLGNRCGAEWCYLLGDFGVKVLGDEAFITPPVRELAFGDWSHQGLPFYAGNVTYHLPIDAAGDFYLQCAQFRNPLLTVSLDGKRQGIIAYAPYTLPISCDAGQHQLDITAYGNRHNAFAAVHCGDENYDYFGPRAWEVRDGQWADEYRLRPIGLQMSPRILK